MNNKSFPYGTVREIKNALEASGNAAQVARQFGLSLKQIYYFCKTRKIHLHSAGRPKKYNYNKSLLTRAIKRAMKIRGGLLKLSQRRNIPYHVITNISKNIK
jgi:hypothetical protein